MLPIIRNQNHLDHESTVLLTSADSLVFLSKNQNRMRSFVTA